MDPWERFWTKVIEAAPGDLSPNGWAGCWPWTARRTRLGYGHFWLNGRKQCAHRVAYEMVIGVIAAGLVIDHKCRRPSCVNPAHLEPVTHRENMRRGVKAQKTHCPAGHEYTPDNLSSYDLRFGQRRCLACHRLRERGRSRKAGA